MRPMLGVDGTLTPEVTQGNHLKHTIGGRPYAAYRLFDHEATTLEVGKCSRKPKSFREECYHAARMVYETHCAQGQPVNVLMSGGVDSEITARSFLEQGIPLVVHHMRYKDGLNEYDHQHVVEFCKSRGVSYVFYDFDPVDFYMSGEAIEYGRFYEGTQLVYLSCLWHIEKFIQGPALLGGEIFIKKSADLDYFLQTGIVKNKWYYIIREAQDLVTFRFSAYHKRPVINEFFSYTPELLASFLDEPVVHDVLTDKTPFKMSIVSSKYEAYANTWDYKPRIKAHGYEKMLGMNTEAVFAIQEVLPVPVIEDLKIECNFLREYLRQGL